MDFPPNFGSFRPFQVILGYFRQFWAIFRPFLGQIFRQFFLPRSESATELVFLMYDQDHLLSPHQLHLLLWLLEEVLEVLVCHADSKGSIKTLEKWFHVKTYFYSRFGIWICKTSAFFAPVVICHDVRVPILVEPTLAKLLLLLLLFSHHPAAAGNTLL